MERYQRHESFFKQNRGFFGYLGGFALATLISNVSHWTYSDQDKAKDAQLYNTELTSQIQEATLESPEETVVLINDKKVTFTLSGDRNCEAKYKVNDDKKAHLAGKIACETTIPAIK